MLNVTKQVYEAVILTVHTAIKRSADFQISKEYHESSNQISVPGLSVGCLFGLDRLRIHQLRLGLNHIFYRGFFQIRQTIS